MAGRPKKVFTDEQVQAIEQMSLDNCHIDTIALALGIAKNTLVRHFGPFIKQKRAEGRTILRRTQCKLSTNNVAMAIFLGKNELGQTDKQERIHGLSDPVAALIKEISSRGTGLHIND